MGGIVLALNRANEHRTSNLEPRSKRANRTGGPTHDGVEVSRVGLWRSGCFAGSAGGWKGHRQPGYNRLRPRAAARLRQPRSRTIPGRTCRSRRGTPDGLQRTRRRPFPRGGAIARRITCLVSQKLTRGTDAPVRSAGLARANLGRLHGLGTALSRPARSRNRRG